MHQLIHFADLRNVYREMREALISANRRAGAQQGLVTRARKKIAKLEAELSLLEQEANQISALLPRLKGRLLQVQQIEQALENLADIKEAVDQQERANGGPSRQSSDDLRRAVERLLERAAAAPRSATASASTPTSTARPSTSKTATRPCWLKPPAWPARLVAPAPARSARLRDAAPPEHARPSRHRHHRRQPQRAPLAGSPRSPRRGAKAVQAAWRGDDGSRA